LRDKHRPTELALVGAIALDIHDPSHGAIRMATPRSCQPPPPDERSATDTIAGRVLDDLLDDDRIPARAPRLICPALAGTAPAS